MVRPKIMHSGIAFAVASIVVGAVPGVVIAEDNQVFTSRFLNSLDQASGVADSASANNWNAENIPSIRTPLQMDEMRSYESSREEGEEELDRLRSSSLNQRRELSWWSIALQFVHPPCPPHDKPQPPHCQHHHHKSGGGGSSSSHSSSSSSSSSGSGGGGGGGGSWASDGWGGDEWGGDEWGSDGYTQKSFIKNPGSLGFWMLIAAACVAAIAVGAIVIGSRRKAKEQYHPLKGSMERRMRLFGGLADRCFEDRELCGAQQDKDFEGNLEISDRGNSSSSAYKQMV